MSELAGAFSRFSSRAHITAEDVQVELEPSAPYPDSGENGIRYLSIHVRRPPLQLALRGG